MDVLPHGCAADPRGCGVCRIWLTFLNASSLINCKSLEQIPKGYEDSVLIALRKQAMWNVVPVPVPTSSGFSMALLELVPRLLEKVFND